MGTPDNATLRAAAMQADQTSSAAIEPLNAKLDALIALDLGQELGNRLRSATELFRGAAKPRVVASSEEDVADNIDLALAQGVAETAIELRSVLELVVEDGSHAEQAGQAISELDLLASRFNPTRTEVAE